MTAPTLIFDRALIRRRFCRALAAGPEDFLLRAAIADVCERLDLIKRDFSNVLDVGTASPELAARLAGEKRLVVRLAQLAQTIGPPPSSFASSETKKRCLSRRSGLTSRCRPWRCNRSMISRAL